MQQQISEKAPVFSKKRRCQNLGVQRQQQQVSVESHSNHQMETARVVGCRLRTSESRDIATLGILCATVEDKGWMMTKLCDNMYIQSGPKLPLHRWFKSTQRHVDDGLRLLSPQILPKSQKLSRACTLLEIILFYFAVRYSRMRPIHIIYKPRSFIVCTSLVSRCIGQSPAAWAAAQLSSGPVRVIRGRF
jgi:hypothetical protein